VAEKGDSGTNGSGGTSGTGGSSGTSAGSSSTYGTFAPTINTVNNDAVVNLNNANGEYLAIGGVVHVWIYINIDSVSPLGTGTVRISDLPYLATATGGIGQYYATIGDAGALSTTSTDERVVGYVDEGTDKITFKRVGDGGNGQSTLGDVGFNDQGRLYLTITYPI
jgi:hypothetical protein